MSAATVFLPVVGPRRHGVVEFGLDLAEAMRRNDVDVVTMHASAAAELQWPPPGDVSVRGVHLQFTDRVFGSTPAAAADAVRALAEAARARGLRVTATLHDVPQPSDGEHYSRRVDAYAAVCDALHAVAVNSWHERLLLSENEITSSDVDVIPLPVQAEPIDAPAAGSPPTVGVFGFLYPGKGHLEVLAALRDVDPSVGMVAIGEPSVGHENLLAELRTLGHRQGRTVEVTGHVADARLGDVLRGVSVPVVHHRHVSASGSLNSWVAAGRRPLASANRYTVEMSERNPGAFLLYEDDDTALSDAIGRALADPGLTWLRPGTTVTPTAAEAADQYARLLRRWHP